MKRVIVNTWVWNGAVDHIKKSRRELSNFRSTWAPQPMFQTNTGTPTRVSDRHGHPNPWHTLTWAPQPMFQSAMGTPTHGAHQHGHPNPCFRSLHGHPNPCDGYILLPCNCEGVVCSQEYQDQHTRRGSMSPYCPQINYFKINLVSPFARWLVNTWCS